MERLNTIIQKIYQKYAPIVANAGLTLNLDFPDTTMTISNSSHLEKTLDKTMKSAVSRTKTGTIDIIVRKGEITVQDNGTILSKTACDLLSSKHVTVKSRLGFGTKVAIKW